MSQYLSELIDLKEFTAGKLNLIEAPCGSGKSRFALNKLPETVSRNSKLLYVIDTINGREQKLKEENTTPYGTGWEELIRRGTQEWEGIGEPFYDFYDEDKIVVITYWQSVTRTLAISLKSLFATNFIAAWK